MNHGNIDYDLLARVGLAALLGVVIGLERQWRQRMAGLQTMALVSMGSALFVVFGAFAFPGADPTRVSAQIVSGIGFLGAGVIIKQGMTIAGLNTAATLWATAAVGALAGAWMWREAVAGAITIFLGNLVMHWAGEAITARTNGGEANAVARTFEIACSPDAEDDVRNVLIAATRRRPLRLTAVTRLADSADGHVQMRARVTTRSSDDRPLQAITRRLCRDLRVSSVSWVDGAPRTPASADE